MRLTSLFALAALLGTWNGSAWSEPLASVNNFNPLTASWKYAVYIRPVDETGAQIDALVAPPVVWTFQQQQITTTIPASPTPYTFTGVTLKYHIFGGVGVAPLKDGQYRAGEFYHQQATRNIPAGIQLNCVYNAPSVTDGDLTCTPTPDAVPPSAPGPLLASVSGISTINLIWGVATDNVGVTGYGIERCLGTCTAAFALVGNTAGTAYSDSGLASGQAYTYRVRASDAANNFGPYSNLGTATTLTPLPPPPPPPAFTAPGTKMPPATKIIDKDGATWTLMPLIGGVAGQTGAARNGVRKSNSVEFVTIDKTGVVWQSDFKSGAGWDRWSGTDWVTTGAAGPVF